MILLRLLLLFVLLSGCSTLNKIKRLGEHPEFNSITIPSVDETLKDQELIKKEDKIQREHVRRTNSLWQPGTKTFLDNNSTWRAGDIIKVVVLIKDSAKLNNKTKEARNSSNNIEAIPEFLNQAKSLLSPFGNKADHVGQGDISRKEDIRVDVAAIVHQVLPNGNLFIQGHQEVRVNYELREIKIAGIIRQKDISVDNSITSDKVAEARISYGGRGIISDVQQKKIGNQILDILPF